MYEKELKWFLFKPKIILSTSEPYSYISNTLLAEHVG